jgi:hypothetical protein
MPDGEDLSVAVCFQLNTMYEVEGNPMEDLLLCERQAFERVEIIWREWLIAEEVDYWEEICFDFEQDMPHQEGVWMVRWSTHLGIKLPGHARRLKHVSTTHH